MTSNYYTTTSWFSNGMTDEDMRNAGIAAIPRIVSLGDQTGKSMFGKYPKSSDYYNRDSDEYYNTSGITTAKLCEDQICKLNYDIHELETRKELIELALCKSLDSAVSTQLHIDYVKNVYIDYMKHGFNSKKFQEFFKQVKNAFFCAEDANKSLDWLNDINCQGFDGGRWNNYEASLSDYQCSNSHVMLWFINEKTKKNFTLHIPLIEHSKHTLHDLNDNTIGKYYITGVYWNTSNMMSFRADEIADWIMKMMTTDKFDVDYYEENGVVHRLNSNTK